jgi:hypothetical protein
MHEYVPFLVFAPRESFKTPPELPSRTFHSVQQLPADILQPMGCDVGAKDRDVVAKYRSNVQQKWEATHLRRFQIALVLVICGARFCIFFLTAKMGCDVLKGTVPRGRIRKRSWSA